MKVLLDDHVVVSGDRSESIRRELSLRHSSPVALELVKVYGDREVYQVRR